MPGEATIVRKVGKEIGKRLTKLASKKAASRLLGKLAVDSKPWRKAFQHIALHFEPMAGKPAHAVYEAAYRSKAGVEELLRRALSSLGRAPVVSKLTIDGVPAGTPCVILEKEFKEVIGKIGDKPCKILRIVVDFTGKPITAFPVEKFLGAGTAGAVLLTASQSQADVPRVAAVEETYATEEETVQERQEKACDRASGGMIFKIIDFLTFDSSCTAVDPQELVSAGEVEARANAAVQTIEARLGFTLDKATQDSIREDVRRIWGFGSPGAD